MKPVIWICGSPEDMVESRMWISTLKNHAEVITLGPEGSPAPDVILPPGSGLEQALEGCPSKFRPAACLNLAKEPLPGLDGMPCPVFGFAGAKGPDGELGVHPNQAREKLLKAAGEERDFAWLPKVFVNLPLADLLGRYQGLATGRAMNFEIGLDCQSLDNAAKADLDKARGLLEGRRITVHLPFFDLSPGAVDPLVADASAKRLGQAVDAAISLGAETCVMHTGHHFALHRDAPAFAERFKARVAPLVERLAAEGIDLALENTFEPGPEPLIRCRNLLDPFGKVGFCLDVGHALCFSKTKLGIWLKALSAHLLEFHLHDNDGSDDQHLPPGMGAVDWKLVKQAWDGLGQKTRLTLEPHNEGHLWATLRGLEKLWS